MIYIDILDKWEICLFTSNDNPDLLIKCLEKIEISNKSIRKAIEITDAINSGFTYTNPELRVSVVYISKASSKSEWFNTLVHELKHVQSHICEYYTVDESGEEAAYLIGYIMKQIILML